MQNLSRRRGEGHRLFGRASGRLKRFEAVAFGPYLALGAILVLFCTQNRLSALSLEVLTGLLER